MGQNVCFALYKTFIEFTYSQVYAKALNKDDHSVPMAFLDVPPFITSLKTSKALLLIGDMVKNLYLAVFQDRSYCKD